MTLTLRIAPDEQAQLRSILLSLLPAGIPQPVARSIGTLEIVEAGAKVKWGPAEVRLRVEVGNDG